MRSPEISKKKAKITPNLKSLNLRVILNIVEIGDPKATEGGAYYCSQCSIFTENANAKATSNANAKANAKEKQNQNQKATAKTRRDNLQRLRRKLEQHKRCSGFLYIVIKRSQ